MLHTLSLRSKILIICIFSYSCTPSSKEEFLEKGIGIWSQYTDGLNTDKAILFEALEAYDHAISIDNKFVTAYLGKGVVLATLDSIDSAKKVYEKAINIAYDPIVLNAASQFYENTSMKDSMRSKDRQILHITSAFFERVPFDTLNIQFFKGAHYRLYDKEEHAVFCDSLLSRYPENSVLRYEIERMTF